MPLLQDARRRMPLRRVLAAGSPAAVDRDIVQDPRRARREHAGGRRHQRGDRRARGPRRPGRRPTSWPPGDAADIFRERSLGRSSCATGDRPRRGAVAGVLVPSSAAARALGSPNSRAPRSSSSGWPRPVGCGVDPVDAGAGRRPAPSPVISRMKKPRGRPFYRCGRCTSTRKLARMLSTTARSAFQRGRIHSRIRPLYCRN